MIVGRSHGGLAQGQQRLVRHGQPVCILVIGLSEVSALDQNGTGPHPQQQTSRRVDVFLRFDGHAGQQFRFRPVGRQKIRLRQHVIFKGIDGVFPQQTLTALADANGIDDQREKADPATPFPRLQ